MIGGTVATAEVPTVSIVRGQFTKVIARVFVIYQKNKSTVYVR